VQGREAHDPDRQPFTVVDVALPNDDLVLNVHVTGWPRACVSLRLRSPPMSTRTPLNIIDESVFHLDQEPEPAGLARGLLGG
jgi:hypothetical protein